MMKKWIKGLVFAALVVVALLEGLQAQAAVSGRDPFPIYECLQPNVEFWRKVYTRYTTKQGIIHDNMNLSIIYEIVDLQGGEGYTEGKIVKARTEKAKKKYDDILRKLARGEPPVSSDEKRVAGLFGPRPTQHDFLKACSNIRCQIGQMDRFREGIARSGPLLDKIKEILESHGLPTDLAYLPHVESSFNLNAYSKFGAAGIWQFTRSTGKRFLEIGYALDERRDPIRSTHAAARFMKENYEVLKDWPMAVTAYNHGRGGMVRAKNAHGSYEAIFSEYESESFKFASRNFYSEFLAARDVAKNYRKYFGDVESHKPIGNHEIQLTGYVSLRDLMRYLVLDIEVIKALNPSLRDPVYTGGKYLPKGYILRLPVIPGKSDKELLAGLPGHLYKSDQKRSLFHRVEKGDTPGKIAKTHGVALSELIWANELDSRGTIHEGQNLRLPAPDEGPARVAMAEKPANKKQTPAPRNVPRRQAPAPEDVAYSPVKLPVDPEAVIGNLSVEQVQDRGGKSLGKIQVQAEETLSHYADWLNVTAQEISRLNGFRNGKILKLNETVKIPLHKISKQEFEGKRFDYHREIEEDFFATYSVEGIESHSIKNGDNIWTLCEVLEVPFWLMIKFNLQLDFYNLQPLQKLSVPVIEEKQTTGNAAPKISGFTTERQNAEMEMAQTLRAPQ